MNNKTIITPEEIEKWKHQAELGSDTTNRLAKELDNKDQECEELKALVKTQDNEIENLRNLQDDLVARNKELQNKLQALDEIERLLKDVLDTEKTDIDESFENFYKCLEIIKKLARWNR